MVIAIVSIAAAIFLALYVSKSQDCKALERDNKWMKEQRAVDDLDNHPLDAESAMEAIRYNGYVPESNGHWITFMSQGEHYDIDAERFPILVMTKYYNLNPKEHDMNLMHKAAHQVSDELIMGKVLFTGNEEAANIIFQITAIENKYGHFKDCLTQYISILEVSQARMGDLYNEMEQMQKEALTMLSQIGTDAKSKKKMLS